MTNEEAIEQFQNIIDLIKQDGKDWLDERDIPLLEIAIQSLQLLNKLNITIKQTDGDFISRKAVLDFTTEWCNRCGKKKEYNGVLCKCCDLADTIDFVEELPTIPQTDISWVKERISKIAMMCDDKDKQQLDILVQLLSLISSINEKGLDKQVIPQTDSVGWQEWIVNKSIYGNVEKQTDTAEVTNDDIETMRILFNADINEYCNQGRWNEAKEYERIRDRLMTALKKTNTAEWKDMGEVSDGYHTFNQLYHQRAILFATIVNQNKNISWKSFKHEDGNYCFDSNGEWFIVGIDTPEGSYTYHYEKKYWDYFKCKELETAKHWDGHTEEDVIRLLSLGDKNDL